MASSLAAYGASLAALALNAAKAAGDALLSNIDATLAAKVPDATDVAVADFFDAVPASYRTEVRVLLTPEILAAQTAINAGLIDRIHTGVAIAQATLDARLSSIAATSAAPAALTATTITATQTVLEGTAAAIASAAETIVPKKV